MLVTPMLTPVLTIGLALSVGELRGGFEPAKLIGKSLLVITIISVFLALVIGVDSTDFLVAICTGVVASFAWAKKNLSEMLPGTAVAVSLVPPISLVGIWLSDWQLEEARFFLIVFIFNLFGVIIGAAAVFSYLKFYKVEKRVEAIVEEIEEEKAEKAEKKSAEKETREVHKDMRAESRKNANILENGEELVELDTDIEFDD